MTPDNMVNFYNTHFYENFDVSLHGSPLDEWIAIMHPDDKSQFIENISTQVTEKITRFISQYRVHNRQGEYHWIEAVGVIHADDSGNLLYMVGAHKDITEKKQYEDKLYQLAYCDSLTGFNNRRKLIETLTELLEAKSHAAIMTFGLNKINQIMDVFGYQAGNSIILLCAECLKEAFGSKNVYKTQPDEFVVLQKGVYSESVLKQQIASVLTDFEQRFRSFHQSTLQSLNVGVYLLKEDNCLSEDAESLLYKSTLIMRHGSEKDDCISFYADEEKRSIERHLFLETGLKKAITDKELYLLFQPIVCAATGKTVSVESLVRWNSVRYGEIMPTEFISVAEENGDIVELGYHVLVLACEFLNQYREAHSRVIKASVNVSVIQLMQPDFVAHFLAIVRHYQLQPENLTIEMTESVILESNPFAVQQLLALDEAGFTISLDDFGSGYTSFNTFFSIPFTQLKLDRAIIKKMEANSAVRAYVKFLVSMCNEKGITVVAEGIEDYAQAERVKEAGVDLIQGFYFHKPKSGKAIIESETV
ncbi:sensor domain-containing protein [Photobacterium arenosum]|uniref:sensor domain-containing protein n=1 Tax=Photobacterium arenosum TaxID=2774143 RepID=UPI00288C62EF|nr:EAL domain-containing protein [Photobacterium arenosum]